MVTKAYLTINAGSQRLGQLDLVLHDDTVPRTVQNFCHFLRQRSSSSNNNNRPADGYLNSKFHRIIRGFMAQGGDFINGDGTGSQSIFGKTFDDENFLHRHDRRGILSMANSGKNTNGSQFFITFKPTPHLDGKHVVFGYVDLSSPTSRSTLSALEGVRTGPNDRPFESITIVDCGVVKEEMEQQQQEVAAAAAVPEQKPSIVEDENELELPEEEEEEEEEEATPKTKAEELKLRMRKLKMKINQARQLNKKEVLREGERLGSMEGAAKARKRQMMQDKKAKEAEWEARNSKALEVASKHGVDGKHLVEQADSSLKKSYKKEEKQKLNQFDIKDYYNPEGQYRNYERNLKSLHRAAAPLNPEDDDVGSTFNPINNVSDEAREREGARNLAHEMKRRIEKQEKKKRERMEFEQTDVSYINQRNKRFNQKIARNFDKHTAEIRQNLERGTAL